MLIMVKTSIISTDEDLNLRTKNFAPINLCLVSTKPFQIQISFIGYCNNLTALHALKLCCMV